MRNSTFCFKHFNCHHGNGSMKIGVDAVVLGAWASVKSAHRILDVGTGCGVIALMCAQRNPTAVIDAIDVDPDSILEASGNFSMSQWADRLTAYETDFNLLHGLKYDLIISNPPYFNSGVVNPSSSRLIARHQSALSPASIISHGAEMLNHNGIISMIVPSDQLDDIKTVAHKRNLVVSNALWMRGHRDAPVKRVLIEITANGIEIPDKDIDTLVLESTPGCPTDQYRDLCRDFYLKF